MIFFSSFVLRSVIDCILPAAVLLDEIQHMSKAQQMLD